MTIKDYKKLHKNLIKERNSILSQINAIEDPNKREHNLNAYNMTSLNTSMIREVEGILAQHEEV